MDNHNQLSNQPVSTQLSSSQPRAPQQDPKQAQIEQLATFLDSAIKLPFINYRIGWEPIIGLIPGIGDVAGVILSGTIIVQAARIGTPKTVLLYMIINSAIEALVGMIPIIGDIFDFVWKANTRNVRLMQKALNDPKAAKSRSRTMMAVMWLGFFGALVLLVLAVAALGWFIFQWIYGLVDNLGL